MNMSMECHFHARTTVMQVKGQLMINDKYYRVANCFHFWLPRLVENPIHCDRAFGFQVIKSAEDTCKVFFCLAV